MHSILAPPQLLLVRSRHEALSLSGTASRFQLEFWRCVEYLEVFLYSKTSCITLLVKHIRHSGFR